MKIARNDLSAISVFPSVFQDWNLIIYWILIFDGFVFNERFRWNWLSARAFKCCFSVIIANWTDLRKVFMLIKQSHVSSERIGCFRYICFDNFLALHPFYVMSRYMYGILIWSSRFLAGWKTFPNWAIMQRRI